jgi:hypothetical protein
MNLLITSFASRGSRVQIPSAPLNSKPQVRDLIILSGWPFKIICHSDVTQTGREAMTSIVSRWTSATVECSASGFERGKNR